MLDAVDPAAAQPDRITRPLDARHGAGDGVEDELDLQLGEAGAQAVFVEHRIETGAEVEFNAVVYVNTVVPSGVAVPNGGVRA